MTGFLDNARIRAVAEDGAIELLEKPYLNDELASVVRAMLDRASKRPSG